MPPLFDQRSAKKQQNESVTLTAAAYRPETCILVVGFSNGFVLLVRNARSEYDSLP